MTQTERLARDELPTVVLIFFTCLGVVNLTNVVASGMMCKSFHCYFCSNK